MTADLELAEGQRDAANREVQALRSDLEAAQSQLQSQADENYMYRDQVIDPPP